MRMNPDQEMIRDAAARFARDRLLANAARLDRGEGADEYVANLRELAGVRIQRRRRFAGLGRRGGGFGFLRSGDF